MRHRWMGDAARVIMSRAIIQEILDKDLVSQCARVGGALYAEMEKLAEKHPELVMNLRGKDQGYALLLPGD